MIISIRILGLRVTKECEKKNKGWFKSVPDTSCCHHFVLLLNAPSKSN